MGGTSSETISRKAIPLCLVFSALLASSAAAEDSDAKQRVAQVIATAGGEEKLLTLFQFRERVLIVDKAAPAVEADTKPNRTSVVQVGGDWWIGTQKRDKDKVRVLLWAWSLRILLDPQAKVELRDPIQIGDRAAFGLRVSGVVKDPVDLWFDSTDNRLLAFDYTDTRHVCSEWKTASGGQLYPSHVTGYRFSDRAKGTLSEKQWYQTDILELIPLAELPAELKKN